MLNAWHRVAFHPKAVTERIFHWLHGSDALTLYQEVGWPLKLPWLQWRGFPLLGQAVVMLWDAELPPIRHFHSDASFALDGTMITLVTPPNLFTESI